MPVTWRDISDLKDGRRDPIVIGAFPDIIARKLGLRVADVYLSKSSLDHIQLKHDVLLNFDILLAPFALRHGLLLQERAKPNIIFSVYNEKDSTRRFIAVSKIAEKNCEVWLQTFHRARVRQTKALLKRANVLKIHD